MFPNNMEFMAGEHRRELQQEADQMRRIKAAGLQQSGYWEVLKNSANWLGSKLVTWGLKLQELGARALPEATSITLIDMDTPELHSS